ncbi:general transcription factor II-I repeat domain-containing protein 2A-like [Scomber scombrus]|uniref:General transcription factor II-I repeat domain-containing protein 2A-like n=1 Tax=Scomber scombrus TaxID=13677 RepID=A0AAV1N6X7_SCOSC
MTNVLATPPGLTVHSSACHCEVYVGSIVIGIDVPPKRDLQKPFEKKISLMENSRNISGSKVVNEAFAEAADTLSGDLRNKRDIVATIENMQLSWNTFTLQCEGMAEDVGEQLKRDIDACECFSLQFDELTDMVDMAQLGVSDQIGFWTRVQKSYSPFCH